MQFFATWMKSPVGKILAIGDEKHLHLLEFEGRKNLQREIDSFKTEFIWSKSPPLKQIEEELKAYFEKEEIRFQTPIQMGGTPFQRKVWGALLQIPLGKTRSYGELAKSIENPKAFRAVALANSKNQLAIIVPCHRVINADRSIGGYGGKVERKKWLLAHEGVCDERG